MIAQHLHSTLLTVAPVAGVAIGRLDDRATWRVDFDDAATAEQKAAAADLIAQYDILAPIKTRYHALLDEAAENVRLRYVTPGAAMAQVYREKLEQAEEVMASGEEAANALDEPARMATYPTLAASVGIEAPTLWECAQIILAKYQQLGTPSYAIERTRLAGKKAIADATDEAGVKAAYEAVTWP